MSIALTDREASRVRALALLAGLCLVPSVVALVWPRSAPSPRPLAADVSAATPVQALWLGAKIDLNRANAASLQIVRGVGPALAARIVADRDTNGPFDALADVARVKGIGPVLAERIAGYFIVRPEARRGTSTPATEVDRPHPASIPGD